MNTERLLRVADLLDAHHDNGVKFNLNTWRTSDLGCGYAACAVGLAMADETFNKEGLGGFLFPSFGKEEGWDAVMAFFELSERQARHLFFPNNYPITMGDEAARLVAQRIRDVVRDGFPS